MMPYINWTHPDMTVEAFCTNEQMRDHTEKNSAFRNARGVRRRHGSGSIFITRWGFKKSFPYPMDDKAFGTLPTPLKFLSLHNVRVSSGSGGTNRIRSWGISEASEEANTMKREYNRLIRNRAPWKKISEKKFVTVFRGFGYEPCNYRWV